MIRGGMCPIQIKNLQSIFSLCIMIYTPHDIYLNNILLYFIYISCRILIMIYYTMYHDIYIIYSK